MVVMVPNSFWLWYSSNCCIDSNDDDDAISGASSLSLSLSKNWKLIKEVPQDVCLAFFGFRLQMEQANGKLPSYNSVASCKNALDYYYEDVLKTSMNKITVDRIAS